MKNENSITLALETGIYGGSISLFKDRSEIASWIGHNESIKSSEYLEAISELLDRIQIKAGQIKRIVISEGPGSYTGLRIGFSIAKGLKTGLGLKIEGAFLFDILSKDLRPITTVGLPFGRDEIIWKKVNLEEGTGGKSESQIRIKSYRKFIEEMILEESFSLLMPEKLYNRVALEPDFKTKHFEVSFCDENFAKLLGASDKTIAEENLDIKYLKTFVTR